VGLGSKNIYEKGGETEIRDVGEGKRDGTAFLHINWQPWVKQVKIMGRGKRASGHCNPRR